MITDKILGKCLWLSVVMFVTYLFLGSYFVSRSFLDIIYLAVLYIFMTAITFFNKR